MHGSKISFPKKNLCIAIQDCELILYEAFDNITVYDILCCCSDPVVTLHKGMELASCTFIKKKDGKKLTKPLTPSACIE